jgi:hypothetical protein
VFLESASAQLARGVGLALVLIMAAALCSSGRPATAHVPAPHHGPRPGAGSDAPSTTSAPAPAGARLRIPALEIDADVLPVGIAKDGNMDVTTTAFTVGWYRYGPAPGRAGDAVMTCHNQWEGAPHALCYDLHSVSPGTDVLTTNADGTLHHWKVASIDSVPYDSVVPGLFATTGAARLSIITCGGDWDSARQIFSLRVIVSARLADGG